ncbi:hypothetical protein, partial [Paraburkholderia heleia]|uniref:hypothetical protein n=1 Tax=Paraburkholderia heleia TaxID=634127 RepID=UPI002AB75FDF
RPCAAARVFQVAERFFDTRNFVHSLALRSSLRIFLGKKSRIYVVRCEVNILVNPRIARKRQST